MNVWIDLENTPHAMIFRPIIERLEALGHGVWVTAKDSGHTLGLLERFELVHEVVGGGERRGTLSKGLSVLGRAIRLAARVGGKGIDVGVSHGSRSHILASSLAGIGCITAYDYEHSSKLFVHSLPDQILLPACLRTSDRFRARTPEKVKFYDGFKEEVYLSAYEPSPDFELNGIVDAEAIVVLVRPPADHVHYHTSDSVGLFLAVMDAAVARSDTQVVLIPRSSAQELQLRKKYQPLGEKVVIPERAVDGLDAIWHSDLVISAGGTMNREAALLGVPTYSILTAALGEADRSLIREGRLAHISTPDHVPSIRFKKRVLAQAPRISASVLDFFVERITSFGQDPT